MSSGETKCCPAQTSCYMSFAPRTHCSQSCLGVQCQFCSVLPSNASVFSSPLSLLFSNLKDSIMSLQGYQCFCQPCTPTPKTKGTSTATVVAKLGAAAFAVIVAVLCLLFAAVAVLVYRLKQTSKMLLVSLVVVHVKCTRCDDSWEKMTLQCLCMHLTM